MDARAAEFQEALARMTGEQGRNIEFGFAVEALVACRNVPAKKTIDPDDFWLPAAEAIELISVDDEQMIAVFVERTHIPPCQRGALVRNGLAFFVKDLIAQPLRLADLPGCRRKPDFERAEAPQHRGQAGQIAGAAVWSNEGGCVPNGRPEFEGRSEVPHEPAYLFYL